MAILGFNWTEADASGIQSIVWRNNWEQTGSWALKEMLTTYNLEDCAALKKVTEFLYAICPEQTSATQPKIRTHEGHLVSQVEEMNPDSSRPEWCRPEFTIPDFEIINKCAYFDYQRDKIFVRTNEALKERRSQKTQQEGQKRYLWANNTIEISSQKCPSCGGTDITRQSGWAVNSLSTKPPIHAKRHQQMGNTSSRLLGIAVWHVASISYLKNIFVQMSISTL